METYGADWPEGTIIEMYGETLRVRENHGDQGVVEYLDGEIASAQFYWTFQGDRAQVIERPNAS